MTGHVSDTSQAYDPVSMALHWIVAGLVFVVGGIGLLFGLIPPGKVFWLNIHALIGMVLLLAVLVRVAWRLRHPAPPTARLVSSTEAAFAGAVHLLLYAGLVVIPIIGLVSFIYHARTFDLGFVRFTPVNPGDKSIYHPTQVAHIWMAYGFFGLIALHGAAALWHAWVRRDGTLNRMLPPRFPAFRATRKQPE